MKSIDKLLKYLGSMNVAEFLDPEQLRDIAQDVIKGYKIDEDSRESWLSVNQEAMKIIKHAEDNGIEKDFPFKNASKVIYPLLAPATIQLASRLIAHIVRNNRVSECAILGPDKPVIDPMTGQPTPGKYVKQERADRVSAYHNYEFLIESDTWLKDTHKLCHILSGWGTAFRQVYYDFVTKKNCSDLISPEDVILNHKISCLEKMPRITIRHFLTKNEILENIRAGYFLSEPLELLDNLPGSDLINSVDEITPSYEFLCQTCYIDLDDDGYQEPYKVYVEVKNEQVYCIVPSFDINDIEVDNKGQVKKIKRQLDIVDYHCIDDPEGGFYSIGLNYLLLHQNKSITSILNQLIDSGTLYNAGAVTGFITKAFKTKQKNIKYKMGQLSVLDMNNPTINPQQQVIPMPFKEPSQVLLGLLQVLIQSGKETGFITDILTGDTAMQNVPATTSMAVIEQATRAYKPMIQKLYHSLKKEFKLWYKLNSKYLNEAKYIKFYDQDVTISKADFNLDDLDIVPVADPEQSSEAHKYTKLRALMESVQIFAPFGSINPHEVALRFYTGMQFENPERLIAPPQQPQPDPKMLKVQLDAQLQPLKIRLDEMKVQLESQKVENEKLKTALKAKEIQIKSGESDEKQMKMRADAAKDMAEASIKHKMAQVAEKKVDVEARKIEVMKNKGGE